MSLLSPETKQSAVSDNDKLVLLVVAVMAAPVLFKSVRRSAVAWALQHHLLTTPYLVPVPGTGKGLDGPHLLLVAGVIGMVGLALTLLGRALLPRKH